MPIYQVNEDQVTVKPIKTTMDFAELMTMAPIDLDELERDMLTLDQEDETPTVHRFAPGIYIREVRLPAGRFLIGHKQRFPHLNIMLTGHVTMSNGLDLVAPMEFVGTPGRKAGVVHEDCVWWNVFATDETDIGKLEELFFDKSEDAKAKELEWSSCVTEDIERAQADYLAMLDDLGVTHELVEAQSGYMDDRVRLPWGAYRFRSAPSPIHGNGIFATAPIEPGELIGPGNINGFRTVLGYGMNHSGEPNAKAELSRHGINIVATKSISGSKAGKLGDEITVDYRDSRKVAICLQ